jgi:hypothetical protein
MTADDLHGELLPVVRPAALFHFAAACLRRVWERLEEADRRAVEAAEDYVRGLLGPEALLMLWSEAELSSANRLWSLGGFPTYWCCDECLERNLAQEIHPQCRAMLREPAWIAARSAIHAREIVGGRDAESRLRREEALTQLSIYHRTIGDPSRPGRVGRRWARDYPEIARLVVALDRAPPPDALGMCALADALEEAGCDDREMLQACRDAPHVRGGWVLEELTGRAARPLPSDDCHR